MTAFILMKKYPGSPKLGTIAKGYNTCPMFLMSVGEELTEISRNFLYNSPEFWSEIKTKEQKLLTTEDGVDIFNGDHWYYVIDYNERGVDKLVIRTSRLVEDIVYNAVSNNIPLNKNYHHFSTYEKAREFVVENSKIFSYKDFSNIYSLDENKMVFDADAAAIKVFNEECLEGMKINAELKIFDCAIFDFEPASKTKPLLTKSCLSINEILHILKDVRGDQMYELEQLVKSKT